MIIYTLSIKSKQGQMYVLFLENKNKQKKGGPVSRVLFQWVSPSASIIYLSNLPPDIRRAALNCRYTWSCRPRVHTP